MGAGEEVEEEEGGFMQVRWDVGRGWDLGVLPTCTGMVFTPLP